MGSIVKRDFSRPDDTYEFVHGRSLVVRVSQTEEVWRSELGPGWNWDEDLEPYADGATSCPMTHREYVVSGRIRYLTDDGAEVVGEPGDFLFIAPESSGLGGRRRDLRPDRLVDERGAHPVAARHRSAAMTISPVRGGRSRRWRDSA